MVVRASVAFALVVVALDGGSYGVVERQTLAVVVWWTLFFALALGLLPRRRLDRRLVAPVVLVAALATLTMASAAWAPSVDAAFLEFDRVLLFLGVLLLIGLGCTGGDVPRVADGLAIGIVAVAAIALFSRFVPGSLDDGVIATYLPSATNRLAYPVGYWNGLAVLAALAVPLLLRVAIGGSRAGRGAAFAGFPLIGSVVFLTSSRTGVTAALLAAVVFATLAESRRAAAGAAVAAVVAGTAGASTLRVWPDVVDGPFPRVAWQPLLALVAVSVACGGAWLLAAAAARRVPEPPRPVGWVALAAAAASAAVLLVAADVGSRVHDFTEPPPAGTTPSAITDHLTAGGGSGRWQLWTSALDEFRADPLTGGGAGSFETWWLAHGTLAVAVATAHSLYLETLAELGVVGLGLVIAIVALLVALAASGPRTATSAAVGAALVAFAFAAGLDWVWDLPAVAVVAAAVGGLATSLRTEAVEAAAAPAFRTATAALSLAALGAAAVPLLGQLELESSRSAARSGDLAAALDAARRARDIQPWAAAPHLQLALVHEAAGQLVAARRSVTRATGREPDDWRIWLVAARLEAKQGALAEARRSLCRAEELNPRSPLLAQSNGDKAAGCVRPKERT
jgi:Flp pilus assembly protein TadD